MWSVRLPGWFGALFVHVQMGITQINLLYQGGQNAFQDDLCTFLPLCHGIRQKGKSRVKKSALFGQSSYTRKTLQKEASLSIRLYQLNWLYVLSLSIIRPIHPFFGGFHDLLSHFHREGLIREFLYFLDFSGTGSKVQAHKISKSTDQSLIYLQKGGSFHGKYHQENICYKICEVFHHLQKKWRKLSKKGRTVYCYFFAISDILDFHALGIVLCDYNQKFVRCPKCLFFYLICMFKCGKYRGCGALLSPHSGQ